MHIHMYIHFIYLGVHTHMYLFLKKRNIDPLCFLFSLFLNVSFCLLEAVVSQMDQQTVLVLSDHGQCFQ